MGRRNRSRRERSPDPSLYPKGAVMKKVFLVVNLLAILAFLGLLLKVNKWDKLHVQLQMTELDRHEVFDKRKLAEYSKESSVHLTDIRGDLGTWIAREALSGEIGIGLVGLSLSILNFILACWIKEPPKERRESASAPAP